MVLGRYRTDCVRREEACECALPAFSLASISDLPVPTALQPWLTTQHHASLARFLDPDRPKCLAAQPGSLPLAVPISYQQYLTVLLIANGRMAGGVYGVRSLSVGDRLAA